MMFGTTSSEYAIVEQKMRDSVELAMREYADPDYLLVAIHPRLEQWIQRQTGLYTAGDATLSGIAGVTNIMVTEAVDSFRVIVCNKNL